MNAKGAAILTNPHPCGHIVYPYTDENLVGQAVCLFASAGLRDGEGVILIVTSAHRDPIRLRLHVEGFNLEALEQSGQLTVVTTEEMMEIFVIGDTVDEELFKSTIGGLIERAKGAVGNGHPGRVRVFGEMVSQLRSRSLSTTTRLEELWNEVINEHSVALLCTYALDDPSDHLNQKLIDLHTHNIERQPAASR
jgi:hypothetical protein